MFVISFILLSKLLVEIVNFFSSKGFGSTIVVVVIVELVVMTFFNDYNLLMIGFETIGVSSLISLTSSSVVETDLSGKLLSSCIYEIEESEK